MNSCFPKPSFTITFNFKQPMNSFSSSFFISSAGNPNKNHYLIYGGMHLSFCKFCVIAKFSMWITTMHARFISKLWLTKLNLCKLNLESWILYQKFEQDMYIRMYKGQGYRIFHVTIVFTYMRDIKWEMIVNLNQSRVSLQILKRPTKVIGFQNLSLKINKGWYKISSLNRMGQHTQILWVHYQHRNKGPRGFFDKWRKCM